MRPELFLLAVGALLACEESPAPLVPSVEPGPPADAGPPPEADAGEGPTEGTGLARANLRFKGGERLRNDYAQALGLSPAEVCRELGEFDCVGVVHTVTLGGVEAYRSSLYEPQGKTAVTTPLAVDRLALSACRAAADRHGAAYAELEDPVLGLTETLYHRLLLREPTPAEVGHLRELHAEVVARGGAAPLQDWAVLACFAVATTTEALFY